MWFVITDVRIIMKDEDIFKEISVATLASNYL